MQGLWAWNNVELRVSTTSFALHLQVRFQYDKSAAFIVQLMDPIIEGFKQVGTLSTPCTCRQLHDKPR